MAIELITTMRYGDHLIGNPALPALHGGTLGALLESAAIFELLWRAETIVLPKTITLTVDYLRSGGAASTPTRAASSRVRAGASPTCGSRRGRTIARSPVATAHAIFLVMRS